ncbi:MAG: LapA family protein [Burkholderiales bacterium]
MSFLFRLIKVAVMLALFLVFVVFAIGNSDMTKITFLGYTRSAPLVLVLFVFLVIGVIVGLLALAGPLFRQRRQIQQLKRDMRLQEQIKAGDKARPETDVLLTMPPG